MVSDKNYTYINNSFCKTSNFSSKSIKITRNHRRYLIGFYTQIQDWLDSVSNKIPSMVSSYFDGFGTKIRSFAEAIVEYKMMIRKKNV
jgi:hypothetical protein